MGDFFAELKRRLIYRVTYSHHLPSGRNRMSRKKYVATGIMISLLTVTAVAAADAPPDFAPNASVGWVSAGVRLLPPPSGPGPVGPARGRPQISNNEVR